MRAKQKTDQKLDRKKKAIVQPTHASNQSDVASQIAMPRLFHGDGSIDSQVAMLKRMKRAQRHAMLTRMGTLYGNRHVMRVVAQLRQNHSADSQPTTSSSHGPPMTASASPSPAPASLPPVLQAKLTLNEPDDAYEQEADQVANAVMRMSAPAPSADEEQDANPSPAIQRKLTISPKKAHADASGQLSSDLESRINGLKGGGQPLPKSERHFFESRMGADFSGVRIHADTNAAQISRAINARAFTVGHNIAFNAGEYAPGSQGGRHLLAHELTHVVQQGAAGEVQRKVQGAVSDQDIQYEIIAHKIGYEDTISGEASRLLTRWGYVDEWKAIINDDSTGFFAGLLMPDEQHPDLRPIIVFRGTEKNKEDLISDLHPVAVGYNQFENNKASVKQRIAEAGGEVDVTGHSLGGALAQHVAAAFPDSINRVVTFQAPAITAKQAEAFSKETGKDRPSATHHIAGGDIVDMAGEKHLAGQFFRHTPGGWIFSHKKFLLMTPEFKERREALGLDDETLAKLDIEKEENSKPIQEFEEYPHHEDREIVEALRKVAGIIIKDDLIRQVIEREGVDELAKRPTSERRDMVSDLTRGITLNEDESSILTVLQASLIAGDVVQVINIANAWEISYATDGQEYDQLRGFLNSHYYAQTSQDTALVLIRRCMDGETAEWEEEMIADILVVHLDGRNIITRIGQLYEKGGFNEGLNKIEWQLDGADQDRVEEVYGESH